jgi:TatD DNase family protein
MKSIIDSHCHVMKEYFGEEQNEVIERAFAEGVVQMVNPACSLSDIEEVLGLAERYPGLYAAVGIHPHEAKHWQSNSESILLSAAENVKVVAIGECGLDFFYNHSEAAQQKEVFAIHVKMARTLKMPIIVHCRDAWDECLDILEEHGQGQVKGVFHCFTGGSEILPRIKKLDFYVSFSGILTFKKSAAIQEAAPLVAENRILVETDCPYLAPQKVRGKRNEPSFVWHTLEKLAELRATSSESTAKACVDNARELFALPILN